ncbi:MAG: hypothetical protein PHF86_04735 [Candidatus Nanoarchaeia archaeon]|jgi:hypothetical protein|nr:hypothetical protein [Candidatus Nanoarchaeia archaeon]
MNYPLKPLFTGENPYRGKKVDRTKFVRLAVVSRVDYETGYVDIVWLDNGNGNTQFIRLPSSHSSLRSCIRGMPEEGSVVICGWSRQTQTWEDPIILGFVDANLKHLLEYRLLRNKKTPDNLKELKTIREKIGYNVTRGKRRKIYPGEIQIESTQGSELYLDDDVYISDSKLNEIEIRSSDKSIRFSSNQIYTSTQASRTWNGMIIREPGDLDFSFQPVTLPNGQKIQFVTNNGQPIYLGGKAFTEHRVELYELSDGIMKANEVNSGYDVDSLAPYISFVMGTLVGNDKTDTAKYAKVLRPQIFGTPVATEFSLDYLECMPEENSFLASTLHFRHQSRAQFDIDKEGHLFTFFPASSGRHSLGPGRSWEAGFGGSVKLVIGAEETNNRSLFLDTKGGIRGTIGFDNEGKSSYIVAQKGLHFEVMGPANDGTSYLLKTTGKRVEYSDGNYNLEVTGNYTVTVHGKYKVESLGTREESYINDKNNLYGGSYKKIVIKDKQEQIGYNNVQKITGNIERAPGVFTPALPNETSDEYSLTTGSRVETFINGNRKISILNGNIEENVVLGDIKRSIITKKEVGFKDEIKIGDHVTSVTSGNKIEEVRVGSSTESITTGDKNVTIKTGSCTISIVAGNINIVTKSGKIKLDSVSQTVDINGMLTVTVKSGVKLNLSGPQVAIGQIPAMGGVVTGTPGVPSHLDFLTGLPLLGSKTVKSSI